MNIKEFELDLTNFEVKGLINKGSFGKVYKIKDKRTGQFYAAKVIEIQNQTQEFKEKSMREIMIACSCIHPTIIKYYGYSFHDFDKNNNLTLIMELMKKGSLANLIEEASKGIADIEYDNTKRFKIILGIAYSLKFLNRLRIMHRDLKPENVLIDENYKPYLTDFNLSKFCHYNQSYAQSMICGTPFYMAPELKNGNINYDFKTDVYSFGLMMIEIISDKIPKSREEFYTLLENATIKNELRDLIKQCLSNDPKSRPTFDKICELLSNIDDDVYTLDAINKYEVEDYINSISKISLNNNFYSTQIAVDELFYQNKVMNIEISKLKKLVEQLYSQNLDQRVTRLEEMFHLVYNGKKGNFNPDYKNFEEMLLNSPTIQKIIANSENFSKKFENIDSEISHMKRQISEVMNKTTLKYEKTKNQYQIHNESNVINNTNDKDSLLLLIKDLQENVNSLKKDNEQLKIQNNSLVQQIQKIKMNRIKKNDEENNILKQKINDLTNQFDEKLRKIYSDNEKLIKDINHAPSINLPRNDNNNHNQDEILSMIDDLKKKVNTAEEELLNLKEKQHVNQHFTQQNNNLNITNEEINNYNIFYNSSNGKTNISNSDTSDLDNGNDNKSSNENDMQCIMMMLSKMQNDMKLLSKDNENMKHQLNDLKQKNDQKQEIIDHLQKEIRNLNQKYDTNQVQHNQNENNHGQLNNQINNSTSVLTQSNFRNSTSALTQPNSYNSISTLNQPKTRNSQTINHYTANLFYSQVDDYNKQINKENGNSKDADYKSFNNYQLTKTGLTKPNGEKKSIIVKKVARKQ